MIFQKIKDLVQKNNFLNRFSFLELTKYILIIIAIFAAISTYTTILGLNKNVFGYNPDKLMTLVLIDLIIILFLTILITQSILQNRKPDSKRGKLEIRTILFFSVLTAIPTILVASFSIYFFKFGIQSWFDTRVSNLLEQSSNVASSYITEHKRHLKETVVAMANDLNEIYYKLLYDKKLFQDVLNAQAEARSIDEAIIFSKESIIVQTSLSFPISFFSIPIEEIEKAEKLEAIELILDKNKNKLLVLVKLHEFGDLYLVVGRWIDKTILDHIDKVNGAMAEYFQFTNILNSLQIKFSLIFTIVALLLVLCSIAIGSVFANNIILRIRTLLEATDKIKKGDYGFSIVLPDKQNDEITELAVAFSNMVKRLAQHEKELIAVQKTQTWSDVARMVAHEIKNPLTPIQLAAEMIAKKYSKEVSDSAKLQSYVNTIVRYVTDIRKILTEFVNLTKLPSAEIKKLELVSALREMVYSKQIVTEDIKYFFSSNQPTINFFFDLTQLHQIIVNLFKNAAESFTEKQKDKRIHLDLLYDKIEDKVIIKIKDNGKGFDETVINKATEAYFTTRAQGTGLGLTIVTKIVTEHCGTLEISNNLESRGAVVSMCFDMKALKLKVRKL